MPTTAPIKPNYDLPWVRGEEHVATEGTSFWQRQREAKGWTREDVEALSDYVLCVPLQMLWEEHVTMPDVQYLTTLAFLYETSPGRLLDDCYEEKGRVLIAEDQD